VEPVKGALFVGVPGTAKSLIVKALAHDWNLPLVRVDVGRLMGSLVGQSEQRAREMTKILEASAPVVAWLDEVEKGLGGAVSSARSDAGTTARVFGHLLTFFQETRAPIAFFATANDTSLLPPELLRRFDAIWFFDVPTEAEAKPIWTIHLRKRRRDPEKFDLDRLARGSARYTGAEIEKAVKEALRRAFLDGRRDVTEQDLLDILQSADPLAQSHADQIEAAKKHLGGLARPTTAGEAGAKALRRPSSRTVDLR
jgi:SpoVK/Ycf46/Vps4 family AAA+-type ATPase